MRQLASSFFLLVILCSNVYAGEGLVYSLEDEQAILCLKESEFSIGGIPQHASREHILKVKGKAKKIEHNELHPLETHTYPDMTIEISNDSVLYLSTSSPDSKTPSGIAPGMNKKAVMKILGYSDYVEVVEYHFVNCVSENYMIMKFNDKDILKSLEMGMDMP